MTPGSNLGDGAVQSNRARVPPVPCSRLANACEFDLLCPGAQADRVRSEGGGCAALWTRSLHVAAHHKAPLIKLEAALGIKTVAAR